MFFIVLGLVIAAASFFLKTNPQLGRYAGIIRIGGGLIFVLGILISCVKQVDAGNVGVQKLFGKVQDRVLYSGLNFVNPFVEVVDINVKTQNYTMSAVHDEGDKGGDDAIRVLTNDGLEVTIDLTVLFKVEQSQAPAIVRNIGSNYRDLIVRPIARTKIRDNAVYYSAIELFSLKREEFQKRIYTSIEADFKARGMILEDLLIRNIDLPQSVKQTIESKINAEQEAQKMQYVLQKEKQEAERKRVEAQGIADYQHILSTGLSEQLLRYEAIKAQKEIALSPNAKVIIMDGKSPVIIGN